MDLHLKDKVIIVTGGAGLPGSIGETIVRSIAGEDGIPVIIDKDQRGKAFAASLEEDGKDCLFIQADLTKPYDCKKAVEKTLSTYDRIDGLVNNLGVNDGIGLDRSCDDFIDSLKLNLVHFFAMTKYSVDALKKSKGSIVNIASKVAVTGQGGTSGYAAAKGGVLALTREWAVDLHEAGIRVNAMVISESWTPGYREWIQKFDEPEGKLISITKKIPLEHRMTKPEEIADAVLFLLSDRSSHTTGQHVYINGGYVHLDRAIS